MHLPTHGKVISCMIHGFNQKSILKALWTAANKKSCTWRSRLSCALKGCSTGLSAGIQLRKPDLLLCLKKIHLNSCASVSLFSLFCLFRWKDLCFRPVLAHCLNEWAWQHRSRNRPITASHHGNINHEDMTSNGVCTCGQKNWILSHSLFFMNEGSEL